MSKDLLHVELFTDGSCSGNPGPGGWAYILRHVASGEESVLAGGEKRTTNNRMELIAVLEGLEALTSPSQVDLFSDSVYVVKGLTEWMDGWKARGWKTAGKKPVKNPDLWKRLDGLREIHEINAQWVQGHNDHRENERCDLLAVQASQDAANGEYD